MREREREREREVARCQRAGWVEGVGGGGGGWRGGGVGILGESHEVKRHHYHGLGFRV
jgi:hypothetical protein